MIMTWHFPVVVCLALQAAVPASDTADRVLTFRQTLDKAWGEQTASEKFRFAQAQGCPPPPRCGPNERTCNLRVQDGCLTWDCCPK
jgi:hypothetical protein